jgi:hypothetical protein
MSPLAEGPKVARGGLVTVAYLKAQLNANNDYVGMFMPLVADVIGNLKQDSVSTAEVQDGLLAQHGLAMPQHVIATLLKRATTKKQLRREVGRYFKLVDFSPTSNVNVAKAEVKDAQGRLASALMAHAAKRGLPIGSDDESLDILLRFLEAEQVAMLLSNKINIPDDADPTHRETTIVAEFVQDVVKNDPALLSILRRTIEGLVLYHAAFLPDISAANQKFRSLRVVFDSSLVRQALGYEGAAMKSLMLETLKILKGAGVQCLVFEKTIEEIRRILAFYEHKLATTKEQQSLRPVPMARHFLTSKYTVSDVRQMSALLDRDVIAAGFQIAKIPHRRREHTHGEKELIRRLASPGTPADDIEPRVQHDVDCIAGVLLLREGVRTSRLEDVKAVFAADSTLVIRNTRLWWCNDERETGLEPVVHIRALTNLAWLKKPALNTNFKVNELIALCSAALRPSQDTWTRFLKHLDQLKNSDRLTSDEVTAILVSSMSDNLLREAEENAGDSDDIDAVTLDEVVDRVKQTYATDARNEIEAARAIHEQQLAEVTGGMPDVLYQ